MRAGIKNNTRKVRGWLRRGWWGAGEAVDSGNSGDSGDSGETGEIPIIPMLPIIPTAELSLETSETQRGY